MCEHQPILNLLYTYAERVDAGDLDGAAALFVHARVKVGDGDAGEVTVDAAGLRAIWEGFIALYPDGTPRTKHVITNPIIAIVSLGRPRPLKLRPRGGGPSISYSLGEGDLFVMGGACQHDWEHCVPKLSTEPGPRLSVTFRCLDRAPL